MPHTTGTPTTTAQPSDVIRVFLVEDQPMIADALGRAIAGSGDLRLLGTSTLEAAVANVCDNPDVIVLDLDRHAMPGDGTPTDVVRRLRNEVPESRLLALSGGDDAGDALLAGCVGHISKQKSFETLANGIRRVHRGEMIIDHVAFQNLLASDSRSRKDSGLTPREMEVLELIAEGLRGRAIAARLTISIDTVRTHTSNVLAKLEAHSQLEAVAIARRLRLLPGA